MVNTPSRMLALLSLLQTQREWPGPVLAQRLGVGVRTVRRDVDRLRQLGYRIGAMKGPDGGYRLAAGSELPPLLFDDEQAVAIAVALQGVAAIGVDMADAAARALVTVRQVMPSQLRHRIDGIGFAGTTTSAQVDPTVLEAVSVAVRDRQTLRFDYGDTAGPTRRSHPHALVARKGRWYLIAWDVDRADWRTFRLDLLVPRTPTGPAFAPRLLPACDASTFLASRSKGSDRDDRWPCVGQVVMDLSVQQVAPWIGDGEIEAITDGSCRLTVGSWSWTGLLAFFIRFDAPFAIVGPQELFAASSMLLDRVQAAASRQWANS